jgi:2-desacetyl-2-hydroxyethyl bacteriochlorophyllide A dehydrogenase
MRAVRIENPRRVAVIDALPPSPGPGQVVVRLTGSGICGSNLPVWEGRSWFTYPLAPGAPGHEGWGTVEQIGEGVTGLTVGTPVAVLSYHAFAELDVADAAGVVPLPASLAGRMCPAEALACAVNVIRRSGIHPGDRVAIVGIGFLGAVLVRLAAGAGARVTAITRRRCALEHAEALGASLLVPFDDPARAVEDARRASGGHDYDVVIEATGLQEPLDVAAELVTTRGRLVIAGFHQDGPRLVDLQSWNWRGLDVVNAHERAPGMYIEGMREAVRLASEGALPLDLLVTHVFPLEAAADAFRCAAERPEGFLKAAIVTHAV